MSLTKFRESGSPSQIDSKNRCINVVRSAHMTQICINVVGEAMGMLRAGNPTSRRMQKKGVPGVRNPESSRRIFLVGPGRF